MSADKNKINKKKKENQSYISAATSRLERRTMLAGEEENLSVRL
jgi:hypothetical protein